MEVKFRNTKLRENFTIKLKLRNTNMLENLQVSEISKFLNFRENWRLRPKISTNLPAYNIII
jgi:hypothetical protein